MIRVQYIQTEDDREIAFFPDTQLFFVVDPNEKKFIERICAIEKEAIVHDHKIEEEFEYVANSMAAKPDYLRAQQLNTDDYVTWSRGKPKTLGRWILHVANDCNLRCAYCYANGGNYYSSCDLMSRETLDRAIDVFYGEFDHIRLVQFFGGEPLLNIDLIEYACKRISEIEHGRGHKPSFGVVTNGTLINDRFIELVRQYQIKVTVSYDCDPDINNQLRPFPNGKGSSEIVLSNIKKLRDATENVFIESTYTQKHLKAGISILDMLEKTRALFPGIPIHIAPFSGDESCPYALMDLRMFAEAIPKLIDESLKSGKTVNGFQSANTMFSSLSKKGGIGRVTLCDAAVQKISVSTKGDVFPCFLFTDQEDMKLGNIFDENMFESEQYHTVMRRVMEYNFKPHHPECRDCFASYSCYHCIGIDRMENNGEFQLSKKYCDMCRGMVIETIKGMVKIAEHTKERPDK